MRACICVPVTNGYPLAGLTQGLQRLGYEVTREADADLLLTWSPWIGSDRAALVQTFTARGKPVIVAENGWLTPIRTTRYYQLALDGWNGTGRYPTGGAERWSEFGLVPESWRDGIGDYMLVIKQRGHRSDPRTMPPSWAPRLRTSLPIRHRPPNSPTPLEADLARAAAVHVWTSNVASIAVVKGIPVVYHGPTLMVADLATKAGGEPNVRPDRLPVLQRLAWAQWTEAELATGEPFARLLRA